MFIIYLHRLLSVDTMCLQMLLCYKLYKKKQYCNIKFCVRKRAKFYDGGYILVCGKLFRDTENIQYTNKHNYALGVNCQVYAIHK